jgi:outer membrane protein TolC
MRNTMLTRDNLVKTVQIDVQRAFKNYNAAILAYKASLVQYEAADYALRLQKESYELGAASQVAVAQATQIYVQGIASKTQAEMTLLFQRVVLDYAMGVLKPADYSK